MANEPKLHDSYTGLPMSLESVTHDDHEYRIAFVREDGGWDITDTFFVANDADANEYAERENAGKEWFVLDSKGKNINGDSGSTSN